MPTARSRWTSTLKLFRRRKGRRRAAWRAWSFPRLGWGCSFRGALKPIGQIWTDVSEANSSKPRRSYSRRACSLSLTTASWISSTRWRANSIMVSTSRRPTPARLALGRTYMPTSRPLWASFCPSRISNPAMPTSSEPWKAPNVVEPPIRSEKKAKGRAFSVSNVLPNASGLHLSPSSRMSRTSKP